MPTIDQLAANTSVSIILKQDQPTGCQVQGFVAEVLTHGNHPRGIKVRLTDGRVGRVQRLASVDEAESGTSRGEELGRNGELLEARSDHAMNQTSGGSAGKVTYHDFRTDGYHYDYERRDHGGPSLEDYIVTKAPRGRKKASRATDANAEDETSTTANTTLAGDETAEHDTSTEYASFNSALSVCPVCHAFEGDEDAVAHHVASHFD